jgi:hypothetical protein
MINLFSLLLVSLGIAFFLGNAPSGEQSSNVSLPIESNITTPINGNESSTLYQLPSGRNVAIAFLGFAIFGGCLCFLSEDIQLFSSQPTQPQNLNVSPIELSKDEIDILTRLLTEELHILQPRPFVSVQQQIYLDELDELEASLQIALDKLCKHNP